MTLNTNSLSLISISERNGAPGLSLESGYWRVWSDHIHQRARVWVRIKTPAYLRLCMAVSSTVFSVVFVTCVIYMIEGPVVML